jgi:hypothetical protein
VKTQIGQELLPLLLKNFMAEFSLSTEDWVLSHYRHSHLLPQTVRMTQKQPRPRKGSRKQNCRVSVRVPIVYRWLGTRDLSKKEMKTTPVAYCADECNPFGS